MLEGLDKVDWQRYRHSYGRATDVPGLIRALLTTEPARLDYAYEEFCNTVNHQGDVMSATAQSVPFLLELLGSPRTPKREWLLGVLQGFVETSNNHMRWAHHLGNITDMVDTYRHVCAGVPIYLRLLTDPDVSVRREAASLIGHLPDQAPRTRCRLWRAAEGETDPFTRAQMIIFVGHLIPAGWQAGHKALRAFYASLFGRVAASDQPRVVRIGACLAWLQTHKASRLILPKKMFTEPLARTLIDALADPLRPDPNSHVYHFPFDSIRDHLTWLPWSELAALLPFARDHVEVTHLIGRELVDRGFKRIGAIRQRDRLGHAWASWAEYKPFGQRDVTAFTYRDSYYQATSAQVTNTQPGWEAVLRVVVENDTFWQLPTNLFSFYYGLPDDRTQLRSMLPKR